MPAGGSISQVAALLRHGADAIYFGVQPPTSVGQRFSLLPTSVEFDLDSARQAMAMINDTGRRGVPRNREALS